MQDFTTFCLISAHIFEIETMKFFTTILSVLLAVSTYAAEYSISLAVKGFAGQYAFLTKVEGDLSMLTDTLVADRYGMYKTTFTDENETGFYKFIFPQLNNAEVAFIFNKENVALSTEAINPNAYVQVISSKENDLYYQFQAKNALFENQCGLLEMIYENYVGDDFRSQAESEYTRLLNEYYDDIDGLRKRGESTFAWKVIKSSVRQVPPMLVSQAEKNTFLKSHFFDAVDFTETELINSEVFTSAAVQYLSIYTANIQQSNKNSIFMSAVDTIMKKASVNDETYEFVVNYLLGGFESMGASEIVTYISQQYLTEHRCASEDASTLQRKALSNTELAVGKQAPLELLTTMNYKKDIDLANENVVVVFWATWCGHCVESVPEIVDHYAKLSKPKYKLVTISLDASTNEWEEFIDAHASFSKSKNLIDTDGWDGKLAETYCIYATPTIFMLQRGKIVAKPIESSEFFEMLKRLKWE